MQAYFRCPIHREGSGPLLPNRTGNATAERAMHVGRMLTLWIAGIAAALLSGCGPPSGQATAPNVAAPPPPAPVPPVVAAPRTPTAAEVERARAQSRLRIWDTQQQAQQVALEQMRRERELAAWQARQQAAAARMAAPRPQFTSQPWLLQPQPLRDTAPLPPATAAIPSATPVYDRPTYLAAGTSPITPPIPRIHRNAQFSNVSPSAAGGVGAPSLGGPTPGLVYVDGYQRSDGSWVRPHFRRTPRR
jgi:hypothetical protein